MPEDAAREHQNYGWAAEEFLMRRCGRAPAHAEARSSKCRVSSARKACGAETELPGGAEETRAIAAVVERVRCVDESMDTAEDENRRKSGVSDPPRAGLGAGRKQNFESVHECCSARGKRSGSRRCNTNRPPLGPLTSNGEPRNVIRSGNLKEEWEWRT